MPPVRDEESETQRKAHAKRVRETRRSTQGVTLEDLKSAEQLVKKKQQQENQQRTSELQQLVASQQQQQQTTTTSTSSTTTSTLHKPTPSSSSTSLPSVSIQQPSSGKLCLSNRKTSHSRRKKNDRYLSFCSSTVHLYFAELSKSFCCPGIKGCFFVNLTRHWNLTYVSFSIRFQAHRLRLPSQLCRRRHR